MKHQSLDILLTIGATIESIDSVRYLSNWSSGKLGCCIASAAAMNGHNVTVLHGKQSLIPAAHPRINSIPYTSSEELSNICDEQWESKDLLIMAAAVSDFIPKNKLKNAKISRSSINQKIELSPTDDIILKLAKRKRNNQTVIGFSLAEEKKLFDISRKKLKDKDIDAIIANPLQTMNSKNINGILFTRSSTVLPPRESMSKSDFTKWLISLLPEIHITAQHKSY